MGGNPNDSTASAKSKGKPCPPDDKKWHPGRELCYHWSVARSARCRTPTAAGSTASTGGLRAPTADRSFDDRAHAYRKREHDYLKMQVEMKSIAYNTEFDIFVEHCEMKRDADSMSLRPWSKGTREVIPCP